MKNFNLYKNFIVRIIVAGVFLLGGFTTVNAQVLTSDLTIGSSGSQVVSLQTWLQNNGYLTMPSGVSMGYFGQLTKNALIKYQISQGITPAVGYFGSITRGHMNSIVSNNQPTISITPISGPVGTPVTVSVSNPSSQNISSIDFIGSVGGADYNYTSGKFSFTIPATLQHSTPSTPDPIMVSTQPGAYQVGLMIEVSTSTTGSPVFKQGDQVNFTVTPSASTSQPSIILTSPNGGETMALGNNGYARIPVTFSQQNFSGFPLYYLIDSSGNVSQRKEVGRQADCSGNCDTTTVLIDASSQYGSSAAIPGQYKVKICDPSGAVCDTSQNYFTLTN